MCHTCSRGSDSLVQGRASCAVNKSVSPAGCLPPLGEGCVLRLGIRRRYSCRRYHRIVSGSPHTIFSSFTNGLRIFFGTPQCPSNANVGLDPHCCYLGHTKDSLL